MRILLDIDGVMIPTHSWKQTQFLSDGFPEFSSESVSALQKIINQTNAIIVLTTSHKFRYTLDQWKSIFLLRGLEIETIERLEDDRYFLTRKDELLNWLDRFKTFPEVIIIDDDTSLNNLPDSIKDKLIQPYTSIGLTNDLVQNRMQQMNRKL